MKEKIDIVAEFGFPFDWEEADVWKLNVPVEDMDISELIWHFDIPFWESGNTDYAVSPNEVMNNMEKYPEHAQRIEVTDTTYPLDILKNPKNGRWTLLDGLHRLAKLYKSGLTVVKVRKIQLPLMQTTKNYHRD